MSTKPTVGTLYDMPVSNNGARCRMILYYKGVDASEVQIVAPSEVGGLKSEQYLKLNPHGKMPTLVLSDSGLAIPESDTIARFLGARFSDRSPALYPPTSDPVRSALVDRICRHHDLYIAGIQGAMYKVAGSAGHSTFPPFGPFASRRDALAELVRQIRATDDFADGSGPYLLGAEPTAADCALFPTAVFWMRMLPLFEGMDAGLVMGPKLQRWWEHLTNHDPVAQRVKGEIDGALDQWFVNKRWDTILGAGLRDQAPATIFDKILAKEIPAAVVYEDEEVLAFRDIQPVAPTHVLVIPKRRQGLTQLRHATAEHKPLLGHMLAVAVPKVAAQEGLDAYRVVVNDGEGACQSVFHLHVHIIGGKALTWPPGA